MQDSIGLTGYAGSSGETVYATVVYPTAMAKPPTVKMLGGFLTSNVIGMPVWSAGTSCATFKITAAGPGRIAARSGTAAVLFDAEF